MYLIVNNTTRKTSKVTGNYPGNYIDSLLDEGNDILVISLYSNSIKVCTGKQDTWSDDYSWKEYPLPAEAIAGYVLQVK